MSEAETAGVSRMRVSTLARGGAVAISLALVLGAGVWGWRLLEREAAGVPVIRAAAGPMRVAPEEPGGDRAEHQGLSVSRIAAGAGEIRLASELHLAPRAADLAADDLPAPEPPQPAIDAMDLAVAEALGLDAAALIRASAPAGPRPAPRPPRTRAAPAAPAAASGGQVVQLGAFAEEAMAAAGWRDLVGRFPDLLEGTDRRIERVEREDRTFWRLRAGGFTDLADARRFCAALTAGEAECIPVVRR